MINVFSSANLNDSYFNDRQDRYLHFKSNTLTSYCQAFLRAMEPYCFKLQNGTPDRIHWANARNHPQHIEAEAGKALKELQAHFSESLAENAPSAKSDDILVFPIIQAGQFNIREEEHCLDALFRSLDDYVRQSGQKPLVDLTSGYFSLTRTYQELVIKSQVDCRILCASPLVRISKCQTLQCLELSHASQANGFYGSRGVSKRIPEGYTLLEQRFWKKVRNSGRAWQDGRGVQLQEWDREGWTYHAKGLWISPAQGEHPFLTLFGSTNLNSRSANLDTELAFVMLTPSSSDENITRLRKDLDTEIQSLRTHAAPWRGGQRKVRLGTKALVGMVGGML